MSDFENDLPPVLESKPSRVAPPPPVTPLLARLMNVIAIPGRVFEEVRVSRHSVWNWLVPAPLYALSLALFTVAVTSMPSNQKWFGEQMATMRAGQSADMADSVKSGKATQADADRMLAFTDAISSPRVLKIAGLVVGLGFGVVRVFWWAFVLWILARTVFKLPVPFGKTLEVAGLSSVAATLGNLLLLALLVNFGESFSGGGVSLVVEDMASTSRQMLVAVAMNGMNFWLIALLGVGLARLAGLPWARGVFLLAAYWIATEFLMLALGAGFAR